MKNFQEQIAILRNYKESTNNDNIRIKECIKDRLINYKSNICRYENGESIQLTDEESMEFNSDILIYLLNNSELQDNGAELLDYFGVNILPYFKVTDIQTECDNYICYETSFDGVDSSGKLKYGQVIFYILCRIETNVIEDLGITRHDLLAQQIIDRFNFTHLFGNQLYLASDIPSITDSDYVTRTLTFQMTTLNSINNTSYRATSYNNKVYSYNNSLKPNGEK